MRSRIFSQEFFFSLVFFISLDQSVFSAVIEVSDYTDSYPLPIPLTPPYTLRQAIILANTNDGSTINFTNGPGTITLSAPLIPLTSNTTIINGTSEAIIIDGNYTGSLTSGFPAFFVESGSVTI